ncbi:uncharacterized protein LOC129589600 [Paramacrobiotus metropolitanus]|uniref:uncharacterized protein LOC129589600 n=1 Tax=Paramacrobiotus metropolitanus TaxID=2943436 RepID=UPI002445F3F1|nr:uncharacterized protein LOC129589600 [Paramacrobiotus metropolitanus]
MDYNKFTHSALALLISLSITVVADTARCRCLPGEPCWPTKEQEAAFNETIGGRLIFPKPTAFPCYAGKTRNPRECAEIQKNYNKPGYLVNRPGSMQLFNWEDMGGMRCSLEGVSVWNTTCSMGRTPYYAVDVHTVADIQKALVFAEQHNIRVVVKSTGHDYLGRSTGYGTLMIWMRNFQGNVQTNLTFMPTCCDSSHRFNSPVITVPAGKTWNDVYPKLEEDFNGAYAMIGGYCYDISAAGGFTFGGGHSPLSPAFGLAADNVLQVTMLTANGELLTANACQNKDLLWAMRGGGGGTFGIVTSITYKLHYIPKGLFAYTMLVLHANLTGKLETEQVGQVVGVLAEYTTALEAAGWGGYLNYLPQFGISLMFLRPADRLDALDAMIDFKEGLVAVQSRVGIAVGPSPTAGENYLQHFNSFEEWRIWTDTIGVFDMFYSGFRVTLGSRFVPRSALADPQKLTAAIMAGVKQNGVANGLAIMVVTSNVVRTFDPDSLETSLTPAWRRATWITLMFTGWDGRTPQAVITDKMAALNRGFQVWRDAYPDTGVYSNEIALEEPNWQNASWGVNYDRLRRIKKAVDPNGIFVCRMCVGSEEWEEDVQNRMCRVH